MCRPKEQSCERVFSSDQPQPRRLQRRRRCRTVDAELARSELTFSALVFKPTNAGSQRTHGFLCVKTRRKRSTAVDSSDSPEPVRSLRSVGPLRYCRLRRRSTRRGTARGGQLEYCSRILEEMLSKEHAPCARPFYNLMDLMDLSTIKVEHAAGNAYFSASLLLHLLSFRDCRKRWTVQSIGMHKALLQTSD